MELNRKKFILQWADNSMILGQRLSEWCGHGPVLEQDIALTNIALDLIGEARYLYQLLASEEGKSEDDYPFLRKESEFYNLLLVEQPNEDWAYTMIRQVIFDHYHYYFLTAVMDCADVQLAAIAAKSIKEARYHLKFSSEWVIRLGDGTEESNRKMQNALDVMAKFAAEPYHPSDADNWMQLSYRGPDMDKMKEIANKALFQIIAEAKLKWPDQQTFRRGGKEGRHSEHMGYLLATMQYMQRAYPGLEW